jgi:hypothetical protein
MFKALIFTIIMAVLGYGPVWAGEQYQQLFGKADKSRSKADETRQE